MQFHFHKNGLALRLALKQRHNWELGHGLLTLREKKIRCPLSMQCNLFVGPKIYRATATILACLRTSLRATKNKRLLSFAAQCEMLSRNNGPFLDTIVAYQRKKIIKEIIINN